MLSVGIAIIVAVYVFLKIVNIGGNKLQKSFIKMGTFNDKYLSDFINRCGKPTANAPKPKGGRIATWSKRGYLITLDFDEKGKFIKIVTEVSLKKIS